MNSSLDYLANRGKDGNRTILLGVVHFRVVHWDSPWPGGESLSMNYPNGLPKWPSQTLTLTIFRGGPF